MRIFLNMVVAVIVAAFAWAAWQRYESAQAFDRSVEQTRAAVNQLTKQVRLRSAMAQTEVNGRGYPVTIDPKWFEGRVPRHAMLSPDRPWLEVAGPHQAELQHPTVRVAVHKTVAGFWYNPANGVVRARAPETVSDRKATELYNRLNGASLASIFSDIVPKEQRMQPAAAPQEAEAGESTPDEAGGTPVSDASTPMTEEGLDPTRPAPDQPTDAPAAPPGESPPQPASSPGAPQR